VLSSEDRRQRRIADRNSDKICFACRAKGHAAKDCPSAVQVEEGKSVVGICYRYRRYPSLVQNLLDVLTIFQKPSPRCGSNKHTLKRCKKQADPSNPMPFASCFVCSGTGHLASTCPQNAAKGVYPNGGSCKLCGETTHLAKDCGLRKQGAFTGSFPWRINLNWCSSIRSPPWHWPRSRSG
jgi:zinc finger CCHC domain-containing protein 9